MSNQPASQPALFRRPLTDGWLGTRELPAYRAGPVVARLYPPSAGDSVPWRVDLLLLDAGDRAQSSQSHPCKALTRQPSHEERSRLVRVVAELARHAARHDQTLIGVGPALAVLCEHGVDTDSLVLASRLLDEVSSEDAVVASLCAVLDRLLGDKEACRAVGELIAPLAGPDVAAALATDLQALVALVVRRVGKAQARRRLSDAVLVELVPQPALFNV